MSVSEAGPREVEPSTVPASAASNASAPTPDITPPVGRILRRATFWIGAGVVLLLVAIGGLALQGSAIGGAALSPENPAPEGAMALAEVLGTQGVRVVFAESLADTKEAITSFDDSTLLIYDPDQYLTDDSFGDASLLAEHVVLVDPGFDQLQEVAGAVKLAGAVPDNLDAECDLPAAQRAGTISGESTGYRVTSEILHAMTCFPSGDDVYSLVQFTKQVPQGGYTQRITVLGASESLSNGTIASDGNAALGLNLLGEHDTLVWYLPGFDDVEAGGSASVQATPPWLTPAIVLLMLAGVAAAIWRGRRLGPLVVENLPVTVRASETMLGRARLYERSGARLRALDALRIGTVQRLARSCGLSRHATVDDVILAAAALTGRPGSEIRALLLDREPGTDPELVQLSDDLLTLERDVVRAIRPGS